MLDCLGGNAPYLAELACRESGCLLATLRDGPEKTFAATLDALHALPLTASRTRIAAALRQAKRRAALAIAVADLGHIWQLPQITGALSELAETALRVALRHLLRELHECRAGGLASSPKTPSTAPVSWHSPSASSAPGN